MNATTMKRGTYGSLALLAVFAWAQMKNPGLLELPPQWLAVAALPMLLALVVGGHITKFKGFGVELEAALKEPVREMEIEALEVKADIPGETKGPVSNLDRLSLEEKLNIRWLLFVDRRDIYTAEAIWRYMQELPNLEFFELRTESDGIVGFLPVEAVCDESGRPDDQSLDLLVQAIRDGTLSTSFPQHASTLKVRTDEGLVSVLRKLRAERVEFAALVTPTGRYLGVVRERDVESRIAESVLATSPN